MSEFTGPEKSWCPCDINQPQHCQPEKWGEAHAHRDCTTCGMPSYQHHQGSQPGESLTCRADA
jgi:hypothetical protein